MLHPITTGCWLRRHNRRVDAVKSVKLGSDTMRVCVASGLYSRRPHIVPAGLVTVCMHATE